MSKDSSPILSVDDLPASTACYERLGFSRSYVFPADGPAAFVALERRGRTIGIATRQQASDTRFSSWIYVDDVDGNSADLTTA